MDSNHHRREAYAAQADEVMSAQQHLTDYQKMVAELFDNKISGLGYTPLAGSSSFFDKLDVIGSTKPHVNNNG